MLFSQNRRSSQRELRRGGPISSINGSYASTFSCSARSSRIAVVETVLPGVFPA